jgi:hypothetical protein
MKAWSALAGFVILAATAVPAVDAAADSSPPDVAVPVGTFRALIVSGVAGDQKHHAEFWETSQRLVSTLSGSYGYRREQITVLFDDEARVGNGADGVPTREALRETVARLRATAQPDAQLVVFVLGHAELMGERASLHLPGRDVSDKEFGELFADFPGRLVVIVATPLSGFFMEPLRGPDRVVITATKADREVNKTRFGRAFAELLETSANAGERPPVGELYMRARAKVADEFKAAGLILTEHAMLDDNGDGEGTREIGEETADGRLALATYFGPTVTAEEMRAAEEAGEVAEAGSAWAELAPPAIVLLKEIDYSVNTDLTYRIRERRRIKILNKGGHRFSEVIVFYNTLSETLKIEEAKTIRPTGEVVALDPDAIRDVKSTTSLFYTESRYKRFSMPSVEDGCILDYTFVKTGQNLHLSREFWKTFPVEMDVPQELVQVRLAVPLTKRVTTKLVPAEPGFEVEMTETEEKYSRRLEFTMRRIPPLTPEPHAPSEAVLGTRLIFTSIPSWETVWDWYHRLVDNARQPDESITQTVAEVVDGCDTQLEKARAIYDYVASKIRYVGLELGPHGYQPHSAASIYENRYGDCKDKATLLLTMLEVAGIEGSIVLVPTDHMAPVETTMPTLDQFNHAIATVSIDGTRYWLDSTGGETAFGDIPVNDQGRTVFVVGKDAGEFMQIPVQPAGENCLRNTGTAAIDRDGTLHIEEQIEYTGAFATTFRHQYRYSDAAARERSLEEALNNFSAGATLDAYSIAGLDELADTVVYTRTYSAPSYAGIADDLIVLSAPLQQIGLLNLTAMPAREQPLRLGQTMRREGTITLTVPTGYRVRNLPEPLELNSDVGTYSESYSVNSEGAIVCRNRFELHTPEIEPEQYPDFRALIRRVARAQRRIIVLIEQPRPHSD